jgi:G3E family GTPase
VEEWLQLANGCICCSVKDSGVNAIESLMDRRGKFDYILLETTGLADPGNIAPLFWVDDGLGSSIYLDGIVTLVDAKNILKCLDEPAPETIDHGSADQPHNHEGPVLTTAHLQISHADVIILNKTDLVTPSLLEDIKARIQSINSLAKLHITQHSQIPQLEGVILDLHSYDNVVAEELEFEKKGHSHLDPTISTITLTLPPLSSSSIPNLDAWLRSILWESTLPPISASKAEDSISNSFEIHRLKGLIYLTNRPNTKIIQGVREVFEIVDGQTPSQAPEGSISKIVLIGRGLSGSGLDWQGSVERALLEGN